MEEKELLTKKFILVDMNQVQISTDEKTIIGTDGLATCVGVLLYSEKHKKAIVAHIASDHKNMFYLTLEIAVKNGLNDAPIKYKIIPGFYPNGYETEKELKTFYSTLPDLLIPFNENEINDSDIETVNEFSSCRFAFDAVTGKFVTNKVLYGQDYINIQEKKY